MKKSRIRLILMTLLILTLALSGCSGGQEAAGPEEETGILQSEDYVALKETLDEIRIDSSAYYVYMMVPNADNDFLITVDGSEEPDDFLTNYGWEVQFTEAMEGTPASARSAWDDDVPCWSGFAPVYNSGGEVVGILGVDYPSPEISEYPEWNRDHADWNGVEEELPADVPEAVRTVMARPMEIAAEAADTLNGEWGDAFQAFMADKL